MLKINIAEEFNRFYAHSQGFTSQRKATAALELAAQLGLLPEFAGCFDWVSIGGSEEPRPMWKQKIVGCLGFENSGLPTSLCVQAPSRKTPQERLEDYKRQYPQIFTAKAGEGIDIEECIRFFKERLEAAPYMAIEGDDGEYIVRRAILKGSKVYSDWQRARVRQIGQAVKDLDWPCAFVTLTLDRAHVQGDVAASWNFMADKIISFMKAFTRKWHIKYLRVCEPHLDGVCHVHLLVAVPVDSLKPFQQNHKSRVGLEGFQPWVKAHWSWGISDVLYANTNAVASYLSKYVGKGLNIDIESDFCTMEQDKKDELTKNLAGCTFSTATCRRQFQGSRGLGTVEKRPAPTWGQVLAGTANGENDVADGIGLHTHTYQNNFKHGGSGEGCAHPAGTALPGRENLPDRTRLDNYLNNWNQFVCRHPLILSHKLDKEKIGIPTGPPVQPDSDEVLLFLTHGKRLGLPVCVVTDFFKNPTTSVVDAWLDFSADQIAREDFRQNLKKDDFYKEIRSVGLGVRPADIIEILKEDVIRDGDN